MGLSTVVRVRIQSNYVALFNTICLEVIIVTVLASLIIKHLIHKYYTISVIDGNTVKVRKVTRTMSTLVFALGMMYAIISELSIESVLIKARKVYKGLNLSVSKPEDIGNPTYLTEVVKEQRKLNNFIRSQIASEGEQVNIPKVALVTSDTEEVPSDCRQKELKPIVIGKLNAKLVNATNLGIDTRWKCLEEKHLYVFKGFGELDETYICKGEAVYGRKVNEGFSYQEEREDGLILLAFEASEGSTICSFQYMEQCLVLSTHNMWASDEIFSMITTRMHVGYDTDLTDAVAVSLNSKYVYDSEFGGCNRLVHEAAIGQGALNAFDDIVGDAETLGTEIRLIPIACMLIVMIVITTGIACINIMRARKHSRKYNTIRFGDSHYIAGMWLSEKDNLGVCNKPPKGAAIVLEQDHDLAHLTIGFKAVDKWDGQSDIK